MFLEHTCFIPDAMPHVCLQKVVIVDINIQVGVVIQESLQGQ